MAVPFERLKQSAAVAKALERAGVQSTGIGGLDKYVGGPAFNHISLEYLFNSTVLPLGIIMQLFGAEGSGKTTLGLHLLNEYFLKQGGEADLIDTEKKINTDLFSAVIDTESEDRFTVRRADYLENAQSMITIRTNEIGKATHGKSRDESPHMLGIMLDSFRVPAKATAEKIKKEGYASKQFAQEALLWRQYLGTYTSDLLYTPVTLIIVNHQIEREATTYGGKVADIAGGQAIRYLETYRIQVKAIGNKENVSECYNDLALTTYKNSNGANKHRINPRIIFRHPDLEPGKVKVDFDIADAKLMTGPDIPRSILQQEEICNITETSKSGLYTDTVNNIKMAPITEIMANIYENEDKLARLRKVLEISKKKTLEELYEDGWFKGARTDVAGV